MSKPMFPHLFSPAKIGNLELKNRILKAPQSSGMSNMDGTVSERLVRYYRKQAAGGAGMIVVEYAYVDDIGAKSAHCHLGISSNEHIPGLAWLAENIRVRCPRFRSNTAAGRSSWEHSPSARPLPFPGQNCGINTAYRQFLTC